MSCQQLIQEDPYIFTDTVSNSTSFMHENNSQTKYVPLNRQTIYNRQFRQHEPKIVTSPTDINNSSVKSTTYSDRKIVISPNALSERKNIEHNNCGKIPSSRTSPNRISPKFFKSHQPVISCENDVVKSNSLNHSNSSVSTKENREKSQQQYDISDAIVNQSTEAHNNGITGIKREIDDEVEEDEIKNYMAATEDGNVKIELDIKSEDASDGSDVRQVKQKSKRKLGSKKKSSCRRLTLINCTGSVTVEPVSQLVPPHAPLVQLKVNVIDKSLLLDASGNKMENNEKLCRDERLSMRKMQLRHVLNQYKGINRFREISTERFKSQISKSFKFCKRMELEKQKILKKSVKLCGADECKKEALYSSDYCSRHILSTDKEQFLIRQCCYRNQDGQQCRIPVNDVLATVAICIDHQNAPPHHLISSNDSVEPKNPVQRKRNKTSPLIRPVKKSGKGGRKKKLITQSSMTLPAHRPTMIIHPSDLQKQTIKNTTTLLPLKQENLHQSDSNQFIHFNSGNLLASSQSSYGSMSSGNEDLYIKQDLMPAVCENSYESSEDTGVGGLSENEFISHDVIDNFDMESCAELSKVLSSLPSNTLDDLLTEPLHTSRDDEEYLDRAIEEVSASGMDQIAITAFEHLEGLDMLDLDEDEQRQMLSAATNLISMSNFLSSHDQDNNYSMPSPMMS